MYLLHSAEQVYIRAFNVERWLFYRLNLVYVYDLAFQGREP